MMRPVNLGFWLLPLLLAGCSDAPSPDQQAEQLLSVAESGNLTAIERLLGDDRVDANVRNSCDWTPLMKAAVNGHLAAVDRLLAAGAEVDAVDQGGYTALLLAASNNHTAILERLLEQGAMIDAQEKTQGYTPLIWAAHRGHRDAVEALLQRGADETLPDFEGRTAADHARAQGHLELLPVLATSAREQVRTAQAGVDNG
jgi:ankyrin repeat protein